MQTGATAIFHLVDQFGFFGVISKQNLRRFERECQTGWQSSAPVGDHERNAEFLGRAKI